MPDPHEVSLTAGGNIEVNVGDGNPVVVIPSAADGLYNIWVGTYGAANASATLSINEIDPR